MAEKDDESSDSIAGGKVANKRSATVYQKKESKGKAGKKKGLDIKRGSNEDLVDSAEKIAFYQPVQLKDIDPMVEIDSDGSLVLESPESIEKKDK